MTNRAKKKSLLVVITRTHCEKNGDLDEYKSFWRGANDEGYEDWGRLKWNADKDFAFLLLHGYRELEEKIQNEIASHLDNDCSDFSSVLVFIHSKRKVCEAAAEKKKNKNWAWQLYSSQGSPRPSCELLIDDLKIFWENEEHKESWLQLVKSCMKGTGYKKQKLENAKEELLRLRIDIEAFAQAAAAGNSEVVQEARKDMNSAVYNLKKIITGAPLKLFSPNPRGGNYELDDALRGEKPDDIAFIALVDPNESYENILNEGLDFWRAVINPLGDLSGLTIGNLANVWKDISLFSRSIDSIQQSIIKK